MAIAIRRRQLILALSGAAALVAFHGARAAGRTYTAGRRVPVPPENDANFRSWRTLFVARLRELGWTDHGRVPRPLGGYAPRRHTIQQLTTER